MVLDKKQLRELYGVYENLGKLLKVPGTSNNFFETFKIKNHIKFSDHPQYDNNIFVILSVLPGWSLFSGLWRIGAVERDSRQWRSPELQDQEGRKEKDKLDNINSEERILYWFKSHCILLRN